MAMHVLVGCECSGIVRDAFAAMGHNAVSCDLRPSERPGHGIHYQCDVLEIINHGWDLGIFHPECYRLATSGALHFAEHREEQEAALEFVRKLMAANIPRIAIENPVSIISTRIRKPDQIVHPYLFGDPYYKRTCLWLKNLPKLHPTRIVEPYADMSVRAFGQSAERSTNRSRTYPGLAGAMAQQWGRKDAFAAQYRCGKLA